MRICILGSEAAGKTCFLGGLAILSEPNRHSAIHVIGADQAPESGSPSQRFLNDVARALRAREWPPPTTLTRDVELDLRFREHLIKIAAIDYAGESFREALNELDDTRQQALIDHMLVADFLLLMLDPLFDLPDASTLSDEARQHMHERQNAHVAGIRKIYEDAKKNRRSDLPRVGLVVTKADLIPALSGGNPEAAERFISERGGALLEKIQAWGVETACFAVSAVGSVELDAQPGIVRPSAALNPFGYDPVFDWVLTSTQSRKRRRFMKRVVAPAALLIFGILLAMILQIRHAANLVPDTGKDLETRVAAANSPWFSFSSVRDASDALVADELGQMRERFEALESAEELKSLRERFAILKSLRRTTRGREINDFERVLGEADRRLSYRRIQSMAQDDPDLLAATELFLKSFPGASEAAEVAEILRALRGRQDETDREKVRTVTVVKGDKDSLNRKAAAIMDYIIAHPSVENADEMRQAAEAARRLAASDSFRVHLSAGGTFYRARDFKIEVFVANKGVKSLESDGKVSRATWPTSEVFTVNAWTPGTAIRIEAWDLRFRNELAGSHTDSDPLSLKFLGRKGELENVAGFSSEYLDGGRFQFTSSVEGFSEDDWSLLEQFVSPGLTW